MSKGLVVHKQVHVNISNEMERRFRVEMPPFLSSKLLE